MFWNKSQNHNVEQGYQYDIGKNFPCQYLKLNEKKEDEIKQGEEAIEELFNENKR